MVFVALTLLRAAAVFAPLTFAQSAAPPPPPDSPSAAASAAPSSVSPSAASSPPSNGSAAACASCCERFVHRGFYLTTSLGGGFAHLGGEGPKGPASLENGGASLAISMGGSLAPGFVLGGILEVTAASGTLNGEPDVVTLTSRTVAGQTVTTSAALRGNSSGAVGLVGPFADWFPDPEGGWHVGASAGLGVVTITDDSGSTFSGRGLALSAFGGYQWWLGRGCSLGLRATLEGGTSTTLSDGNGNDSGYRLTPFSFAIRSDLMFY